MWHEVHGSGGGRPLVLLHGNLSTIGVDFGGMLPSLAKGRQVIGVEQQTHGHTADIDRPLSIRHWTDDTAALLDHLGIGQADVFGYSSGSPPNPGDWPKLIEKIKQMEEDNPEWSAEDVRGIAAPTMLVIGDSDIVRPEHGVELFRLLGGGVIGDPAGLPRSRLAVLPGTTHVTLVQRSGWLASMVGEFLDAEVS
jgi:pimeloyl-ACP methyl ester carboxylesterase